MPDQPTTEPDTGSRPFAAILQRINNGKTATEMSLAMQDLIAAVESTGKAGKLQLTLTVEPAKNSSRVVTVSADVAVKAPSRPNPATVFFIDDAHNLRDSDPLQEEIPGIVTAVPDPRPATMPVGSPFTPTADGAQA